MASRKTAFRPLPREGRITSEGYPYIIIGIILMLLAAVLGWFFWLIPLGLLTAFVCYFFRNPSRGRDIPEGVILAPADGKIISTERIENYELLGGPAIKVSTFMSIFNCHVNRAPISGLIENVTYNPGKFFVASLDKASKHNERNTVIIKDDKDRHLVLIQIAGVIARRIVCYLKDGFDVIKGSRLGVICFGSRVELFLPENNVQLKIKVGDKVRAGETIIAAWS